MTDLPLRLALFSGNYNYVRDGANQSLNRLAAHALNRGVGLRVYSPTTDTPAFPPTGDLVSVPSTALPFGRGEYRLATGLPASVRADLAAFAPTIVHTSAPDILGHRAVTWAKANGLPVVASVHTLFETYLAYYKAQFLEGAAVALLRRYYNRCDALLVPSEHIGERLRGQGITAPIDVWSRGVDHERFNPARRDLAWRRSLGLSDDVPVVGFLGRLVLEKGLDMFAATAAELRRREVPHQILVVGDGPARADFERELPGAVFAGFVTGDDLARAVASFDIFLQPSVTETFGNVTLEAQAAGVPAVAADVPAARSIVLDGVSGQLVPAYDPKAYADAIAGYVADPQSLHAASAAAVERAKAFDWEVINDRVVAVWQREVARARSRVAG